jgi:hypothetical protein
MNEAASPGAPRFAGGEGASFPDMPWDVLSTNGDQLAACSGSYKVWYDPGTGFRFGDADFLALWNFCSNNAQPTGWWDTPRHFPAR